MTPGYTAIYDWHAIESAESATRFEKGQTWDVTQVESLTNQLKVQNNDALLETPLEYPPFDRCLVCVSMVTIYYSLISFQILTSPVCVQY